MTKATKQELAVITPEEQAYLDSLEAPGSSSGEYSGPARLEINVKSKDADGNKRTIGAWHIRGTDKYYDGEVIFRPVRHMYKLIRYNVDNDVYTVAGQSIYFKEFSEEILDSMGTIALGRKFGKAYSDEEREATRKLAECYLEIFGFVTFGDAEPEPVVYRVRGKKLMKFLDAFRAVPKGKRFSQYAYKLTTDQPEGKTFWDINITPDLSKVLPLLPILKYDEEIMSHIQKDNLEVIASYKRNKNAATGAKLVEDNINEPLTINNDDSDLPF